MQHEEFAEWFRDHVSSIMQFIHDLFIVDLNLAYALLCFGIGHAVGEG
jgi:hypothetical protein